MTSAWKDVMQNLGSLVWSNLPKFSGWDLARFVMRDTYCPIVMLAGSYNLILRPCSNLPSCTFSKTCWLTSTTAMSALGIVCSSSPCSGPISRLKLSSCHQAVTTLASRHRQLSQRAPSPSESPPESCGTIQNPVSFSRSYCRSRSLIRILK